VRGASELAATLSYASSFEWSGELTAIEQVRCATPDLVAGDARKPLYAAVDLNTQHRSLTDFLAVHLAQLCVVFERLAERLCLLVALAAVFTAADEDSFFCRQSRLFVARLAAAV
jgi:hypothetical protein